MLGSFRAYAKVRLAVPPDDSRPWTFVRRLYAPVHVLYRSLVTMPLIYSLLWSFCLSLALAIEMPVYIKTPSKVTAGKTFQASLTAEVHNGGTRWVKFFRVYLATSYREKAHYFYDADCMGPCSSQTHHTNLRQATSYTNSLCAMLPLKLQAIMYP